jgi:hypothetical protein
MSGECDGCGWHCLECQCSPEDKAIEYAIFELEGVHHDLTHQFSPNDGGVCAATIARVLERLIEARVR